MDGSRRRISDGASGLPNPKGPTPAVQVVGFRVEGATPSPPVGGILNDPHRPVGAGSPTPVIIPPSFQSGLQHPPSARPGDAGSGKPLEAHGSGSAAIPAPEGAQQQQGISLPPPSLPKPIAHPEKSEAGHAGLVRPQASSPTHSDLSTMSGLSSEPSAQPASKAAPAASASSQGGAFASATAVPAATAAATAAPAADAEPAAAAAPRGAQAAQSLGGGGPSGSMPPLPPSASKQQQGPPVGKDKEKKSQKEMTKAERRELQEAQRAAKAAAKTQKDGGPPAPAAKKDGPGADGKSGAQAAAGRALESKGSASIRERAGSVDRPAAASAGGAGRQGTDGGAAEGAGAAAAGPAKVKKQQGAKVVSLNSTELFAHLQQYKKVSVGSLLSHKDAHSIHPAVLQLGLRYADGTIRGATARCVAMLHTFCQVIRDYKTPEGKSLSRDLTQQLNAVIAFLVECRPLAVSMGNAIKLLKLRISQIDPSTPEADAKASLIDDIREYLATRITAAHKELVRTAVLKVDSGDVILTYAYSHVVGLVLTAAAAQGKRFRVVVVDSRPESEGRIMLQKLQAAGIACTYVHLNALSFVIREVTKVFLGAAAVMSNGTVMGRAGNAAVAMMAHAHSKPVMICSESFKFHERVQLDSITHNELGDPEALAHVPGREAAGPLAAWEDVPRLGLLNLKYDAMPAEYVTMIVTEFGMIPPTSVPVILREYQQYGRELGA